MGIKELRKSKKITQENASKILNIPLRTYKRIENNEANVSSIKKDYIISVLSKLNYPKTTKQTKRLNIGVIGSGYVGFTNGVVLAANNSVTFIDKNPAKLALIQKMRCPFEDCNIDRFIRKYSISFLSSSSIKDIVQSDVILICLPTDFDIKTNSFNTSSIEEALNELKAFSYKGLIIIKSTVQIGFTDYVSDLFPNLNIVNSPEFLREGSSLQDCIHPSRIIYGIKQMSKQLELFNDAFNRNVICGETLYLSYKEAEATKLFSNAYLATRVSFFNEVDSYSYHNDIDAKKVIKAISADPRIGDYYNNPSFGFGGYCLPKDSMMLKECFSNIEPDNLFKSVIDTNEHRKNLIVSDIIDFAQHISNGKNKIVFGIYKIGSKKDNNSTRNSVSLEIYNKLKSLGKEVVIFDSVNNPSLSFSEFVNESDVIVANRIDECLKPHQNKVFSRDIYNRD